MRRRMIWYGEKILSSISEEVNIIDESIKVLIKDMFDTMLSENGAGLAAVQIGVLKKVITLSIPEDKGEITEYKKYCLINAKIIEHSEETIINEEGCLSFPDIRIDIPRYKSVVVEYLSEDGESKTINASGFLAIALQHEIDHTEGIVFIDRLHEHAKKRMKTELRAIRKESQKRAERYEKN